MTEDQIAIHREIITKSIDNFFSGNPSAMQAQDFIIRLRGDLDIMLYKIEAGLDMGMK